MQCGKGLMYIYQNVSSGEAESAWKVLRIVLKEAILCNLEFYRTLTDELYEFGSI